MHGRQLASLKLYAAELQWRGATCDSSNLKTPWFRLVDIAERIGVSVMTVSKALRDQPDVAASTRSRIKAAAKGNGLRPTPAPKAYGFAPPKFSGSSIPSTQSDLCRMVYAIEERAKSWVTICSCAIRKTNRSARALPAPVVGPPRRWDFHLPSLPDARLTRASIANSRASKTPVVLLGSPAVCGQFMSVKARGTHRQLCRHTQHLLELGHQTDRLLYPARCPPSGRQERYEDFAGRTAKPALTWMTRWCFHAGSTIEDGNKAALQFVNEQCQRHRDPSLQ